MNLYPLGQYVVQYVFRAVKEHGITWAVAGFLHLYCFTMK